MTGLFAGTPFYIPPTCDDCGKLESECDCTHEQKALAKAQRERAADRLPPTAQTARITIEKRKGGRQVTVVDGLTSRANDLADLLTQLQSVCGTGGTVKSKEDLIEIQGDHAASVEKKLQALGFKTTRRRSS